MPNFAICICPCAAALVTKRSMSETEPRIAALLDEMALSELHLDIARGEMADGKFGPNMTVPGSDGGMAFTLETFLKLGLLLLRNFRRGWSRSFVPATAMIISEISLVHAFSREAT